MQMLVEGDKGGHGGVFVSDLMNVSQVVPAVLQSDPPWGGSQTSSLRYKNRHGSVSKHQHYAASRRGKWSVAHLT